MKPQSNQADPRMANRPSRCESSSRKHLGARRFGFRIAAIMLGLLPFGIAELTLRALDIPKSSSVNDPFLDCSQLAPLFESDSNGIHRIPPERMRLFAPAEFDIKKPLSRKRVFSLGGSTTQGEPYGPPTAFTAWLGINLELIAPDTKWEMINCGGLSYASYRILPILREVLEYAPDLIVIYCGQNEFLEARELDGWRQTPATLTHIASNLYQLRFVRMLAAIVKPAAATDSENRTTRLQREVDALLDIQGGLEKYNRDTLNRSAVVASFRWNLQQMVEACHKRKVPLVLVVPAVNLRDCPPFKMEADPHLSVLDKQNIESLWGALQSKTEKPEQAIESMENILAIDPQHAGAHYFLGQQAIADHDWESARQHLTAAKDYDVCPLRATSEIQQVVRDVAIEHRVPLLDADLLFQSKSPHGLVGRTCLIDHVHPNIEGHQLLGDALAELLLNSKFVESNKNDWEGARPEQYRTHLSKLDEAYFIRGQQRLEGLMLWTQGRAKNMGISDIPR